MIGRLSISDSSTTLASYKHLGLGQFTAVSRFADANAHLTTVSWTSGA